MNVKNRKQNRASRVLREMNLRHASAARRWRRQEAAARKCRYSGYFALASASVSGHYVVDYAYSRTLRAWAINPQGACHASILDDWRGISGWRQAKKLAMRMRMCHGAAWRPGHWLGVMPWRCV